MNKHFSRMILVMFFAAPGFLLAQTSHDTLPSKATLSQCISYALANQALIKQSFLDEEIAHKDIRIALSNWYPQLELDVNYQNYFKVPMAAYPNLLNPSGPFLKYPGATIYGSSALFSANQTLYSTSLLFAAKTSRYLLSQASENTENTKINVFVDVTKAFFDVLLTEEQLGVLDEDILRLQQNYKDANNLYRAGITDNIDFQRTQISLSNTLAQRKSTEGSIKAKYSVLKQLIGLAPEKQLYVSYDSSQFEKEITIDTTRMLDYNNRIEFKLLQTSMNLQGSEVSYYRWSFLPKLSAFYDYNSFYGNNIFSDLYSKTSNNSLFGLKLTLPIFQGNIRLENLSKSKLRYERLQLGMDYLKSQINSEYTVALNNYLSNLNQLKIAKNNIALSKKIYNTVVLQYNKGIKAYLEVIVSETDLRTSELNYLNTLFQVLSSKLDLQKAMGDIQIN